MDRPPQHDPARTALVLGGGGAVGNAWLIGVIAGLGAAGLDVTDADLVVGTSAGATAAAQITGADPADLLDAILTAPTAPRVGAPGTASRQMDATGAVVGAASGLADLRRRMGAWALDQAASSDSSAQERWRAVVAARLPGVHWPTRRVLLTAVDADTGDPVAFDRDSGVDLVDAVAASCSSGFAYRVGVRRLIDGGYRTNADNADLAAGHARVLVLSPLGGRSRTPAAWGTHLATQVERLRADGSVVETVVPDAASRTAFGDDLMDLSRRAPAARAGHDQGRAAAEPLAALWR